MMEPPDHLRGVTEVSTGTPPADLADFYPRAYQRLVGTLRVMGVPGADAVEIAQEAFVRLIPRWAKVRDYDSPDGWLRTVAWRLWLNRVRGSRSSPVAAVPDHPAPAMQVEEHLDLAAALAGLPAGHREVVVLHYLVDLPVARIATELGVAEGTVKSRLHRARAALAAALDYEEVDDD